MRPPRGGSDRGGLLRESRVLQRADHAAPHHALGEEAPKALDRVHKAQKDADRAVPGRLGRAASPCTPSTAARTCSPPTPRASSASSRSARSRPTRPTPRRSRRRSGCPAALGPARSTSASARSSAASRSRTSGSTSRTATATAPTPRRTATPPPPPSEVAAGLGAGTLPPFLGIRIKPLTGELAPRSLRTLDLFLTDAARARPAARCRDNFVVTLPKITSRDRRRGRWSDVFEPLEDGSASRRARCKLEIMVETTQTHPRPERAGRCCRGSTRRRAAAARRALRDLRLHRQLRHHRRAPEDAATRRATSRST